MSDPRGTTQPVASGAQHRFLDELAQRVLIFDGAFGTWMQTHDLPRFVIGSMGPGTRLPSLGQIPYTELRDGYRLQVEGLIAGGTDVLLIETVYDLLQAKAAINGARAAMRAAGVLLPLMVQV